MKRIYIFFVFALLIIILFPSFAFSERGIKVQSRRLALVIGNGAYKSSPLRNPVNDAYDMAKSLRRLGFEVIHKENASRKAMKLAIRNFGKRLRRGGIGLFFFAGHGVQVNGRNYLIPIDAMIESESDVEFEAVDAGRILGKMEDAENELNIVILDACRDDPYSRSFRTSTRGLARMDAPTGSFIAYATAPGSVAIDGSGRNGVFTGSLLKNMVIPGVKIEDVLKRVRNEVIQATNRKQVPWQSSSLMGDFYFVIEGKITVTKVPPTKESAELEKDREKLERERQELEQLKLEVERKKLEAERIRLEAEKKKFEIAKIKELEAKQRAAEEKARKEAVEKKALEDKLKRLETEKKKLKVAKLPPKPTYSPSVSTDKGITRDGTFIAYSNGVVYDSKTGLEWFAGSDKDTSWDEARTWVKSLSIAGGGWRMPKMDELRTLYEKGAGTRNITPLLKTTGWFVWSTSTSHSAFFFLPIYSLEVGDQSSQSINDSHDARGFAVRSLNK